MIYIENTSETQRIDIPVSYKDPSGDVVPHYFRLYNTINLDDPEDGLSFEVVPVKSDGGLFYTFSIQLPENVTPGTYEYALMHGYSLLSSGVAVVGEYKNQDEQYHKDIEYEQYTGE